MKTFKCVLVLFAFVGLILVGCSDESQSPVVFHRPVDTRADFVLEKHH